MKNIAVVSLLLSLFACQGAPLASSRLRGGTLYPGAAISGSGGGSDWMMRGESRDVLLRIGASTVRLVDAMPEGGLHYTEEASPLPHFVLALATGMHARWRGTSLSIGAQVHQVAAPGEYVVDVSGSLAREPR